MADIPCGGCRERKEKKNPHGGRKKKMKKKEAE
jgi:hypothetical protein